MIDYSCWQVTWSLDPGRDLLTDLHWMWNEKTSQFEVSTIILGAVDVT